MLSAQIFSRAGTMGATSVPFSKKPCATATRVPGVHTTDTSMQKAGQHHRVVLKMPFNICFHTHKAQLGNTVTETVALIISVI